MNDHILELALILGFGSLHLLILGSDEVRRVCVSLGIVVLLIRGRGQFNALPTICFQLESQALLGLFLILILVSCLVQRGIWNWLES